MRRTFICAAVLCFVFDVTTSAILAARPNIVLIMADDMGYGDVGCYNAESKISTPHMDGLTRQGMRFTDAHTPSSVCTPTRYGLLTGLLVIAVVPDHAAPVESHWEEIITQVS